MTPALVAGLLSAAVLSALLTALAIPLLRRAHVIDIPVDRSLHERPVPRGGGLAVVLAVALSVWTAPLIVLSLDGLPHMSARFNVVVLGLCTILAFALVGLAEDLYSLPTTTRFGLQLGLGLLLGLGACLEFGGPMWLAPVVAVCSAGLVNVTNFMDGANGLAGGHAVIAAGWFVAVSLVMPVPGLGFVMIVMAGACLGFLPFNAPRARVFLGDSGSYALGGAWSFAATVCLAAGVPADVSVAPLLILVADTGYTLWLRVHAGQRWYEPHKLHVYQRMVSAGWPHWGSALLVSGTALACCAVAAVDLRSHRVSWPPVIAMVLILLAYLHMPMLVRAPSPFHRPRAGR